MLLHQFESRPWWRYGLGLLLVLSLVLGVTRPVLAQESGEQPALAVQSESATTTDVTTTSSASATSAPGFTGEWQRSDGTINLRARAYSPMLGRFLQRDTFAGFTADPQSLNRYAYTQGNPVNLTDPSGFVANDPANWAEFGAGALRGVWNTGLGGFESQFGPLGPLGGALGFARNWAMDRVEDQLGIDRCNESYGWGQTVGWAVGNIGLTLAGAGAGRGAAPRWPRVGNVDIVPDGVQLPPMRSAAPSGYRLPPSVSRTAGGINDGPGMLYRGDSRTLGQLGGGFQPRNPHANVGLQDYVFNNGPSQYVSTTRDPGVAGEFVDWGYSQNQGGNIYTLDPGVAARGVDVNATLGWDVGQAEMAIPGGVGLHEIVGVRAYQGNGQVGPFVPNPYYQWNP